MHMVRNCVTHHIYSWDYLFVFMIDLVAKSTMLLRHLKFCTIRISCHIIFNKMFWISSLALTQVDCWHTYHHSKVVVLLVMLPSIFAFTLICFYFNLRKNLHFSIFIISFMLNVVEGLIAKIHCVFFTLSN